MHRALAGAFFYPRTGLLSLLPDSPPRSPQSNSRRPEFDNDCPDFNFGPAEQYRVKPISGAKDTTAQKDTDAATLYENILTIQNAADLEWPATDPANAGVRDELLLGIFPPDHGGNHTPPPTPTPAPTSPAK